jgi:RNA ligase (TIGR02306 family)
MGLGLAWAGRVMTIAPVEQADRLERAEVVCGEGGRWWGVVSRGQFKAGDACTVYLPDSVVPDTPEFSFMAKYRFRVRMQRLRGAPSEVLITAPLTGDTCGTDLSELAGVQKYEKKVHASLLGLAKGNFPAFLRKTDEPNFQRARKLVERLKQVPIYITEKADGSSCTIYRHGEFGVCSRNLDLKDTEGNAYWQAARKYGLAESLPDGMAVQGELVGPGIQGNPMGLTERELWLFNVYQIGHGYWSGDDAIRFARASKVPFVKVLGWGVSMPETSEDLQRAAIGTYPNGEQREGIVIRSTIEEEFEGERVSVKVINLAYKDRE